MHKNKHLAAALPLLLFGLALAILPQYVFPACPNHVPAASGGAMHAVAEPAAASDPAAALRLPCYFTARSASGLGVLAALGGLLLLVFAAPAFGRGVSALTLGLALLAAATPHWLLGVCAMPNMPCRLGLTPAINTLSALLALASLANLLWLSGDTGGKNSQTLDAGKEPGYAS